MSLPSYVMKKHLTALNKIIRKEHTIKGISKIKKVEVAKIFNNLFEMKNNEPVLKTSKSELVLNIKKIKNYLLQTLKDNKYSEEQKKKFRMQLKMINDKYKIQKKTVKQKTKKQETKPKPKPKPAKKTVKKQVVKKTAVKKEPKYMPLSLRIAKANKIKDQKIVDDTKSLTKRVKIEYDLAVKKMKKISKKIRKTDKLTQDDYKYLKIIPKYRKETLRQRIKRLKKIIKKYRKAPREFKKNI